MFLVTTQSENTLRTKSSQHQKHNIREDSCESIDRDEEVQPLQLSIENLSKQSFRGSMRRSNSRFKEMPSYKLDGAKLLVNRLMAQLKKSFDLIKAHN
jgi:hypothetical protein